MSEAMTVDPPLDGLLEPHSHRVELTGPLGSLGFPDRCANCGVVTRERLPVRKVFGRNAGRRRRTRSRVYRGYRIDTAQVPYCRDCIAQDARERQSMASRWRARVGTFLLEAFPALFPLAFAVFLLTALDLPRKPGYAFYGFEQILALLFGSAAVGAMAYAWWSTRRCLVPRQTSVTLAFDFSPDVSDLLDHVPRRVYAMRDAAFAEAFIALNRDRVWQPDPAAVRAEMRVWIMCAVVLAVGAVVAALLNR